MALTLKALKTDLEGKMEALQGAILEKMPSLDGLRKEVADALEFIDANPLADAGEVLDALVESPAVKDVKASEWGKLCTLIGASISDIFDRLGNAKD